MTAILYTTLFSPPVVGSPVNIIPSTHIHRTDRRQSFAAASSTYRMRSPTRPIRILPASSSAVYASPPLTPVDQNGAEFNRRVSISDAGSPAQALVALGISPDLEPLSPFKTSQENLADFRQRPNDPPSFGGHHTPAASPTAPQLGSPSYSQTSQRLPPRQPLGQVLQYSAGDLSWANQPVLPPLPPSDSFSAFANQAPPMPHEYHEWINFDDDRERGGNAASMSMHGPEESPEGSPSGVVQEHDRGRRDETPDNLRLPGAGEVAECDNCGLTQSPCWRRTKAGMLLCNACGLYQKNHGRARPKHLAKRTAYKGGVDLHGDGGARPAAIACFNCDTSFTPLWRKTADGRHPLCNACGLYEKTHGRARPLKRRAGSGPSPSASSSSSHRHNPIKRSDSSSPPPNFGDYRSSPEREQSPPSFPLPTDYVQQMHPNAVGLWNVGLNGEGHFVARPMPHQHHESQREYTPFDGSLGLMGLPREGLYEAQGHYLPPMAGPSVHGQDWHRQQEQHVYGRYERPMSDERYEQQGGGGMAAFVPGSPDAELRDDLDGEMEGDVRQWTNGGREEYVEQGTHERRASGLGQAYF